MTISTRGRYAARAMLDLALHRDDGKVLLKDIAARQEVSARYLEQVMIRLKAAGLVTSARGAQGGFALARPPKDIKLSDVIRAVEGSIAPVQCVDAPTECSRATSCVTRDVWVEMERAATAILESVTVQDLVERHREKQKPEALMYHI